MSRGNQFWGQHSSLMRRCQNIHLFIKTRAKMIQLPEIIGLYEYACACSKILSPPLSLCVRQHLGLSLQVSLVWSGPSDVGGRVRQHVVVTVVNWLTDVLCCACLAHETMKQLQVTRPRYKDTLMTEHGSVAGPHHTTVMTNWGLALLPSLFSWWPLGRQQLWTCYWQSASQHLTIGLYFTTSNTVPAPVWHLLFVISVYTSIGRRAFSYAALRNLECHTSKYLHHTISQFIET